MFASRPCRLALTVTCRQILGTPPPKNAGALEQAENGQKQPLKWGVERVAYPLDMNCRTSLAATA